MTPRRDKFRQDSYNYKSVECLDLSRFDVFAWLFLSVAEWSSAEPCTELGRTLDVLIPAVRNSSKQIDQASNAQEVAGAINAYADAAGRLARTIQRLRPQLEKLPADEPEACREANRRLEAFQPEINAVIEKLDYKRRRYSTHPTVTNAWKRVISITKHKSQSAWARTAITEPGGPRISNCVLFPFRKEAFGSLASEELPAGQDSSGDIDEINGLTVRRLPGCFVREAEVPEDQRTREPGSR